MNNEEKIQKIKEDRKLEYTTLRRLIIYTCRSCKHIFEWIDDRHPNYCPECKHDRINLNIITSQIVSISNQGLENE